MSVSVACGVAAVLVSLVSALGWLLGRPPDFLLHQPGHQPALHAAERVESLVRRIRAPMLPKCRRVTVLRGYRGPDSRHGPGRAGGRGYGSGSLGPARIYDEQQSLYEEVAQEAV